MYILIFEPHKGCRKILLDGKTQKINLGRSLRDGYANIQLSSDFLPDYVGLIIYNEGKFYFRNYGKIKIFVDNKQLDDSSVAVRLVHGSMIKIQHKNNKSICIGCINGEIDNRWRIFNPDEHGFLNVQKDKKEYIIRNVENMIFKGQRITTDCFIPKNGDIFIYKNHIFCCMKDNLFFEVLKVRKVKKNINYNENIIIEGSNQKHHNINPNNLNKNKVKKVNNRKPAIVMKNVTRYDKKKKWYRLKDVNLTIYSGRLVAIMGVSGAGKSTLFDAILKRLKLDSGDIIIDGNELGHVPQFSVLRKGNTVQEVMEFYASKKLKRYSKQERMQKIDYLLDKLNLALFKQSLVGRLSGGQSRRLDIAVQLLNEPKVILMDEPDSGLDVKSCRELYEILSRLVAEKNSTILVITHNTHMACKYPYIDDLLFMASQGRICFYGEKDKALEYFNINDLDDIYNAVENNQDYFVQKYNNLISRRDW
ncbi:metal ABC transporter ATP-binding protein [Intestinibacter bartlettii]|uniref:ABC transporter ATP-binding protein n=1 Tax=Intestinibacter bartlettii TaxID=261299 RepID=A0ABS6DTL5_9FIRM|nr:ABC transporter ATP-binding protein [Intestinibacter bartlettii]MBU5335181.1 ABC transporter ATP-binding protein [Intestinibacter bartlettii]MDO5010150.1 ABC transporter ATP-binding protein [Intestinibacter bartlettii]